MRSVNTEIIIATALENMNRIDDGAFEGFTNVYFKARRFWNDTKTGVKKMNREEDNAKSEKFVNMLASRTYFQVKDLCAMLTSMEALDLLCSDTINEAVEARKRAIGI